MSIRRLALTSVTCTNADTQYTTTIPRGTKYLEVFTNHASAVLRIAFETGKVAAPTEPYINIPNGKQYYIDDLTTEENITIYVASSVAGAVAVIHTGTM